MLNQKNDDQTDNLSAIETEVRRRLANAQHMGADELAAMARAQRDVEDGRAERDKRLGFLPLYELFAQASPEVAKVVSLERARVEAMNQATVVVQPEPQDGTGPR